MSVYLRVKPIGTGAPGDPIRVPLPTYRLVQDLGVVGWIVEIREDDIPAGASAPIVVAVPGLGNVNVITSLPAQALTDWTTQLDKRYPQRDRANAPQIA